MTKKKKILAIGLAVVIAGFTTVGIVVMVGILMTVVM